MASSSDDGGGARSVGLLGEIKALHRMGVGGLEESSPTPGKHENAFSTVCKGFVYVPTMHPAQLSELFINRSRGNLGKLSYQCTSP